MLSNIVERICIWNEDRDNLLYDTSLEFTMLSEELQEYVIAKQKMMLEYATELDIDPYSEESFSNMTEEETKELTMRCKVEEADALADIIFVAVGSLYKLTGGSILRTMRILDEVIDANNSKGKDKKEGKITKPKDFVGPEKAIRNILEGVVDGKQ